MNQMNIILKHLTKHKFISSMVAFENYGITRLSAVIYDLREAGYNIGIIWRQAQNRYGNTVRYVDYYLVKNKRK